MLYFITLGLGSADELVGLD